MTNVHRQATERPLAEYADRSEQANGRAGVGAPVVPGLTPTEEGLGHMVAKDRPGVQHLPPTVGELATRDFAGFVADALQMDRAVVAHHLALAEERIAAGLEVNA